MKESRTPIARTAGVIADELLVPLHRVQYVIRTRDIKAVAKAGTLAIYDRSAVARIRHELNAIDARRPGACDA